MAIIDCTPWEIEGLSQFDWGVKQMQKRASERFASGATYEEKFGETEERYWQKRCFVEDVFAYAQAYLRLKVQGSVRILFKFQLEGDLVNTFPLPSPALARVRIARIDGKGTEPRCEWRVADAAGERSAANDSFDAIRSCFGGPEYNRISAFLESHFGVNLAPNISHYPEVSSIQARMVLLEPLGALAVMEGDSRKITHDAKAHVIHSMNCFTYLNADELLSEA